MRITVHDLGSRKSVDIDVAENVVIHIGPSSRLPKILSISLITPLSVSECPSCGSSTAPEAAFCVYCGSRLPYVSRSLSPPGGNVS